MSRPIWIHACDAGGNSFLLDLRGTFSVQAREGFARVQAIKAGEVVEFEIYPTPYQSLPELLDTITPQLARL